MLKSLSAENGCRLRTSAMKLAAAAVLMATLAISASAYTLVFRDGQRIEISSEFTVTRTTLTYEVSPGFSKTVLLALLDIAATERANNEVAGGFFKHKQEAQTQSAAAQSPSAQSAPSQRARVTLTNRDLEAIKARRIESEKRYEQRRIELGLPSVAQTRRLRQAEESAMLERIRDKADLAARDEAYWRGRARSLRGDIAVTDAQINYVRSRLGEISPSDNYGLILGGSPYDPYGPRTAPNIRSTGAGVVGDGGNIYQNQRPDLGQGRRRRGYPNIYGYPDVYGYPNIYGYPNVYGYPNIYGYPNTYPVDPSAQVNAEERTSLTERLNDLLATRAALNARWLLLEDEARDARVPQVWLEP